MPTLMLRLSAPLQSWGADDSKFETRRTNNHPTKSGVIGLLAAALGYSRNEPLDTLINLKFGVRVDKEGVHISDYHTAQSKDDSYITTRHYLSDAAFTVGLESDDLKLLETLKTALLSPVYPLFLGRRSCPPTMPLVLGISEKSIREALQGGERLFLETDDVQGDIVRDMPVSFSQAYRRFAPRREKEYACEKIYHDAFSELEE